MNPFGNQNDSSLKQGVGKILKPGMTSASPNAHLHLMPGFQPRPQTSEHRMSAGGAQASVLCQWLRGNSDGQQERLKIYKMCSYLLIEFRNHGLRAKEYYSSDILYQVYKSIRK